MAKLIAIPVLLLFFSCQRFVVCGRVIAEHSLPEDLRLYFSVFDENKNEKEFKTNLDTDGEFKLYVNNLYVNENIKYTGGSYSINQKEYKNPCLALAHDGGITASDYRKPILFYFLDSDRDIIIKNENNMLDISWKEVPFENVFYSVRIEYKENIVKDCFTKDTQIALPKKSGKVNSDMRNIISDDFDEPQIIKNEELQETMKYYLYLEVFQRRETGIVFLSIQKAEL